MLNTLIIGFVISAIITCIIARVLSEDTSLNGYLQCVLFGWLFVIIVLLYCIFTIGKALTQKILDKVIK